MTIDLPVRHRAPWIDYTEPSADHTELRGSPYFDQVIVGAGLVGTATAYELVRRQPEASIAILDADAPASGASGRGTGLVGPRIGPPIDVLEARFGAATARRAYEASEHAVELVSALCVELDVAWTDSSQYVVARSAAEQRMIFQRAAAYRRSGIDVRIRTARELAHLTSRPQWGGVEYKRAGLIDPAQLTGALAREFTTRGGRVYHRTRVRHIDRSGGRVRLVTDWGPVFARSVIVATNSASIPSVVRRVGGVIGVEVFGAMAAPTDAEPIGAADHAFIGADPLAPFHVTRADGCTIVGGGGVRGRVRRAKAGPDFDAATWDWLAGWLVGARAESGRVPWSHRWSGPIAVTADGLPVVGPVPGLPDVWFMGGCGGHGLAIAAYNATVIADALLSGRWTGELPWLRGRAPGPASSAPIELAVDGFVRVKTAAMRRSQSQSAQV